MSAPVAASFDYGSLNNVGDGQAWRDEACDRLLRMLDAQDRAEEIEDPDIFVSPAIREMCLQMDAALERKFGKG